MIMVIIAHSVYAHKRVSLNSARNRHGTSNHAVTSKPWQTPELLRQILEFVPVVIHFIIYLLRTQIQQMKYTKNNKAGATRLKYARGMDAGLMTTPIFPVLFHLTPCVMYGWLLSARVVLLYGWRPRVLRISRQTVIITRRLAGGPDLSAWTGSFCRSIILLLDNWSPCLN